MQPAPKTRTYTYADHFKYWLERIQPPKPIGSDSEIVEQIKQFCIRDKIPFHELTHSQTREYLQEARGDYNDQALLIRMQISGKVPPYLTEKECEKLVKKYYSKTTDL
jgi:hypothetical protein